MQWYYILGVLIFLLVFIGFGRRIFWFLAGFDQEIAELKSKRKSAEVRLGKIAETLAPFTSNFPVPLDEEGGTLHFLGAPIDYVYFHPDGSVTFIEIKSGQSALSKGQKRIRDAIKQHKVTWCEVRM